MSKKKRVKSKAAQATAKKKSVDHSTRAGETGQPESVEWKGGGGMLTGMRSGFQSAVQSGGGQKKKGWLDKVLWIAVIAAAAFFILGKAN